MMTLGCFTVQGFSLNSDQNQNIPEISPTHDKTIKEHKESPFKIEKIDNEERLCAYHLQIHKLNSLLSPEPIQNWSIDILHHKPYANKEKNKVNVKIAYKDCFASFDEDKARMNPLDDLRADYPWECIEYASKNNRLTTRVRNG